MIYDTLTPDQLMTLTSEEIRVIIRKIGQRINQLHDQAQAILPAEEREKLSAEWRGIVQVRKTLYDRLYELGEDAFLAQAA